MNEVFKFKNDKFTNDIFGFIDKLHSTNSHFLQKNIPTTKYDIEALF